MYAIAVDIGGTSAKVGLVDSWGRVVAAHTVPTGGQSTASAFVQTASEIIRALRRQALRSGRSIAGVGVGVPGLVDVERGIVRTLVNLPRWRNTPLRSWMARSIRLPTLVENDVNAMTWGEYCWGAGRGAKSLFCMTLGTGVGGGIVLDGWLYRGATSSAGEIGHVPLGIRGPRCPCGGEACLERYVGNRAILAMARQRLRTAEGRRSLLHQIIQKHARRLTPPLIDHAAIQGDRLSRRIWQEVAEMIGVALTGVVNVLNPERIVIGGGIAKAGALLFPTIRATVRARAMRGPSQVRIVPARHGEQAGLVGAAALVLQKPDRRCQAPYKETNTS